MDAAGGDVGVDAVIYAGNVVVGPCSLSSDGVVEVGVDKAIAPYAVIAREWVVG